MGISMLKHTHIYSWVGPYMFVCKIYIYIQTHIYNIWAEPHNGADAAEVLLEGEFAREEGLLHDAGRDKQRVHAIVVIRIHC